MRREEYTYDNKEALRCFSMLFSRSVIMDILRYKDFSILNSYIKEFQLPFDSSASYASLYKFIYAQLCKKYATEYVYKNEFISRMLIRKFGTSRTVAFSEFRIGNSIVDMALFNGESKAFEIKTEFDSPARLASQLKDYSSVFNKCYIIIPEQHNEVYSNSVAEEIGILNFVPTKRNVDITMVREALPNHHFDYDVFMKALHTKEYESIIIKYFKQLPDVSSFQLYDECAELMKSLSPMVLRKEFNEAVKRRKNNTPILKRVPREFRQAALAMHLSPKDLSILTEAIATPISL